MPIKDSQAAIESATVPQASPADSPNPTPRLLPEPLYQELAKLIDRTYIPHWLEKPCAMLGGHLPAQILAEGNERLIWEMIDRMQAGDLS